MDHIKYTYTLFCKFNSAINNGSHNRIKNKLTACNKKDVLCCELNVREI